MGLVVACRRTVLVPRLFAEEREKKVGGWPDISFSHISSLDDLFTNYFLTTRIDIIYAGKKKRKKKRKKR